MKKTQKLLRDTIDLLGPKATIQKFEVLLFIYMNPNCTAKEVIRYTGLSVSGASRIINDLSPLNSRKQPGLNLIELGSDINDRRIRTLSLSQLGAKKFNPIIDNFLQ